MDINIITLVWMRIEIDKTFNIVPLDVLMDEICAKYSNLHLVIAIF